LFTIVANPKREHSSKQEGSQVILEKKVFISCSLSQFSIPKKINAAQVNETEKEVVESTHEVSKGSDTVRYG
jgi:hypothetical protein